MLPLRGMVIDVHLLVGPMLGDQVVKKLLVDVVVEVLDSDLDLGRLSDVIFVDLKKLFKSVKVRELHSNLPPNRP